MADNRVLGRRGKFVASAPHCSEINSEETHKALLVGVLKFAGGIGGVGNRASGRIGAKQGIQNAYGSVLYPLT